MSIDLKEFGQDSFEGKITEVTVRTLEDWLKNKRNPVPTKSMVKFKNLDRAHVCIVAEFMNGTVDDFFMVPELQGWQKSNLKKLIEKNGLPLVKLPEDAGDWVGLKVALHVDSSGFMRLSK